MEPCPSCFQNVEILESHYGTLYTCPHCHAVFFVGWDGKPEVASHTANSVDPVPAPSESGVPNLATPIEPEAPIDFAPISYEPQSADAIEPVAAFIPDETQPEPIVVEPPQPNQFQDVVDFGNSVNVEGTLSYTLKIQGIDHSSVLQEMKDLLDDSRLGWKIDDVLAGIQNGELVLSNLSPGKASVIVQRLKTLPLRISWKQVLATV